jgi:alkanesulfonate monooxygenase SsuD/methylene tetrahydromethanopterin reductase-like flavin-dependent oxidoreductase (luciferase family)
MENHGAVFKDRWKIVREKIEAMKRIWTEDEAEYHGRFVNFDPIWSWPKPVQKPHPPIILGGDSTWARQRVVDYCDGWMPIFGMGGDLKERIEDLHARARKVGRDPKSISLTMFGAPADVEVAGSSKASASSGSCSRSPRRSPGRCSRSWIGTRTSSGPSAPEDAAARSREDRKDEPHRTRSLRP